jgi:CRISPR-associated protein Cas2
MAKKKPLTFYERILKIKQAGLGEHADLTYIDRDYELLPLEERLPLVDQILRKAANKKIDTVYTFITYDIGNNKVRNLIARYLIKKGCVRIQKSVYLAELKRVKYNEIYVTLKEINAMYDNQDSIFFIPVGEDVLNTMKIIGLNIEFELIVNPGNTLFI